MSRIRSQGNTTTELRLAAFLRKHRLIGWRRRYPLIGRPDFVWPRRKLAVFVDGCFWHGHRCGRNLVPNRNAGAWQMKITNNQARDRRVARKLRASGWDVIRVWECALAKNPSRCVEQIRNRLMGKPRMR
jgi:DNA mismatch endonuclease (patch repair protein)